MIYDFMYNMIYDIVYHMIYNKIHDVIKDKGGQHGQHCVKNKFVKNRVGGRGSTSIWKMSLNILFFLMLPPRNVFQQVAHK